MSLLDVPGCRACGRPDPVPVLDLGRMPPADLFPPVDAPRSVAEAGAALAMVLCGGCGLAQLARDDTRTEEPRGVEPRALREQAADAVARVAADGLLTGRTVREFGSPHGGSWIEPLAAHGLVETTGAADVVLDCFGLMHERDQRGGFAARVAATAPGGVLLVQYHPLHTIVVEEQWNALRHGHFGYYSLAVLRTLLRARGFSVVRAWDFTLYGGTVLIAARADPDATARVHDSVARVLAREAGAEDPRVLRGLQRAADRQARDLREMLREQASRGMRVYAYGAASRAVALFARAGIDRGLVAAVADASPAKQGRRMPGTDVPIISPEQLVRARPDRVLLTVPDLLDEVGERYPELEGAWFTGDTVAAGREGRM